MEIPDKLVIAVSKSSIPVLKEAVLPLHNLGVANTK